MASIGEIVGDETAAELRQQLPHKPPDEEPSSAEQARREIVALGVEVRDITTFLAVRTAADFPSYQEFADWRKRTILAKNHKERRLTFLKEWMRRRKAPKAKAIPSEPKSRDKQHYEQYLHDVRTSKAKAASEMALDEIPLTVFLRQAARRIGLLEHLYRAAVAYVDEDTDETWEQFLDATERTRVIFADAIGPDEEEDE